MTRSNFIALLVLAISAGLLSSPALAKESSGTALITGCKSGSSVPGYKHPGFAIRAFTRFACGSSVYVWNATTKAALVQQETKVAYISSKYVFGRSTSSKASPVAMRTFLQGIAEGLREGGGSAISAREQLVRSCLGTRGCQVEAWWHLAWIRIRHANQLVEPQDSTLRFFADGIYYSALVVNPPLRFKDHPVPSVKSPVLLLDGGGLSLAIVDQACYTLGADGKWDAAGASAVQSAAIQR